MEHRALATILFLVSSGCGFEAGRGEPPPHVATLDGAMADADETAEALVETPTVVAPTVAAPTVAAPTVAAPTVAAPAVAAPSVAAPVVAAPVADEAVEDVLADAPRADTAPARLDPHDVMGIYDVLPAISSDGRLIMTARYETASDSIYVDLVRASNGRHVRSLPIALSGDDGETLDGGIAAVDRILERRGFVTFGELDEVLPEDPDVETWDGVIRQWTSDDLAVHYDPQTGGLAVYREYRLLHQSLVRARVPDGPGVGLMDPAYTELPMIPSAHDVRISADGKTLAIRLAACDCTCDIEPFWKLIRL